MKNFILLTVIFVSFFGKVLGNGTKDEFETVLKTCNKSILFVVDEKIYLNPEMLFFYNENFYLKNDLQEWVLLGNHVLGDKNGFFTYKIASPRCRNGHVGFKYHMTKRFWTCLDDGCEYNYGNYF